MPQDDKALLVRLQQHQVDFLIIGGVCGVLHGVTLVTKICCRFTPQNLRRIEAALKDLHPIHRLTANKLPFELTDDLCARLKNIYLQTDLGKLDCLSEIAGVGDYEQALKRSEVVRMPYGQFRILDIDALIDAKEAAGREQDLLAVKQLRAIRERHRRSKKTT
jgi:hypothetical protein